MWITVASPTTWSLCAVTTTEECELIISRRTDASLCSLPLPWRCVIWLANFDHRLRNHDVPAHHWCVFFKRRCIFLQPGYTDCFPRFRVDWATQSSPFPWKEMGKYILVALFSEHSSQHYFLPHPGMSTRSSNAPCLLLLNSVKTRGLMLSPPCCCLVTVLCL